MNQQPREEQRDHVCPLHSGIEERTKNNSRRLGVLEVTMERVQNRLPVWATAVISLLTLLLGALGAAAFGK